MQYIESRLIEMAARAKRCLLDNGNAPALPSLSEGDAAEAEGFLDEVLLCCPLLGLSVFSSAAAAPKKGDQFFIRSKGAEAQGMETSEGFVVQSGSTAVKSEVPSCHTYVCELRSALVANGVLKPFNGGYAFTQDYVFNSPSTAAGVVQGRSANGRVDWRTKNGRTLKEIQEAIAR